MRNKESPLISAPKTQLNLIAFFSYFYLFEKLLRVSRGRRRKYLVGCLEEHTITYTQTTRKIIYICLQSSEILYWKRTSIS